MSLRTALSRLFHQGKFVLQKLVTKPNVKPVRGDQLFSDVSKHTHVAKLNPQQKSSALYNSVFARYASNTLVSELRRRAAWQFGNVSSRPAKLPTFAFGLVGLAFMNKHDDKNDISDSIRETFKDFTFKPSSLPHIREELCVDKFDFGKSIGQGCNAAVYEVKLKDERKLTQNVPFTSADVESDILILNNESRDDSLDYEKISFEENEDLPEQGIILENETLSDFSMKTDISSADDTDSLTSYPSSVTMATDDEVHDDDTDDIVIISEDDTDIKMDENFEIVSCVSPEVFPVPVYHGPEHIIYDSDAESISECISGNEITNTRDYNLAMKMIFNYDTSNTDAIMKEFRKEIIPFDNIQSDNRKAVIKKLPPHPNIVDIQAVFVDEMPELPDGSQNYPMAQPSRINPDGHGRNKTMFILMKRYTMTLREFLNSEIKPSIYTRCVLLTQLLEGIVHLKNHGIAHRDLKSDNVFVDIDEDNTAHLVISDFGCCLADVNYGLKIPYQTDEVDRGGIPALMAPEIASAVPGRNSWLDYSKADLWTVGTLVYELFDMENPFLDGKTKLDCRNYVDTELPRLPGSVIVAGDIFAGKFISGGCLVGLPIPTDIKKTDEVPPVVQLLTKNILQNDPKQRLTPEEAANFMQIFLWFPDWLMIGSRPMESDITNSLLMLAAKLLICCNGKIPSVLDQLKMTFLKRVKLNDFKFLFTI